MDSFNFMYHMAAISDCINPYKLQEYYTMWLDTTQGYHTMWVKTMLSNIWINGIKSYQHSPHSVLTLGSFIQYYIYSSG